MSLRMFAPVYGLLRTSYPICECGAKFADRSCDFRWTDLEGEKVCDAKLCEICAVDSFGEHRCAGHAAWEAS